MAFSIAREPQHPGRLRDTYLQNFKEKADALTEQIVPLLTFVSAERLHAEWGAMSSGAIERLSEVDRAVASAETLLNELKEIVRVSRDQVQEVGVSQHAAHFSGEAQEHKKWARWWLAATAFTVCLTGAAGVANYFLVMRSPDTGTSVQLVVAKVIVFSLLFSAVVWCAKIYRAHRHNYVVNRHRQNALSSFETFAKGSDDPQTKNAVLLQATQSIFAPNSIPGTSLRRGTAQDRRN
jgi:hypothetical protein